MLISESQSRLIQLLRHPQQPPSPSWDGTGQFVIRSWIWRHAVETDVRRYPGVCSKGVCVCVCAAVYVDDDAGFWRTCK